LAKIDKSQYTKDEWRIIREQRRLDKQKRVLANVPNQVYVLCLKHGTKYSYDYVNKLYAMVKKNLTIPFQMVCLTEDSKGIHKDVMILPLPPGLQGWWCKPYIYSKDLPIQGTILYLDLDVVISGNMNKLIEYCPEDWCTIRDFTRVMRPKWEKYNSSVVRFKTGQLDFVWSKFIQNPAAVQRKHFGDQDWLYEAARGTATLYPDGWIRSWKWEIRKSKEFMPGGRKGNRVFKHVEDVVPPDDCCICVFHGDPNPHNCTDPYVVDNWQKIV